MSVTEGMAKKKKVKINVTDTMTVPQLKEALKKQGLPVSGKKAELVERLKGGGSNLQSATSSSLFGGKIMDVRALTIISTLKEKYKPPDLPPWDSQVNVDYPYHLTLEILLLHSIAILFFCIYFIQYVNSESGAEEFMPILLLGLFVLWIYLFFKIGNETGKLDIQSSQPSIFLPGLLAFVIGLFSVPGFLSSDDNIMSIPCCSSLVIFISAVALDVDNPDPTKLKEMEIKWKMALEYEENGKFDQALILWNELEIKRQIERVECIVLECYYLMVRRKILDLEAAGVDCAHLRKGLDEASSSASKLGITFVYLDAKIDIEPTIEEDKD